MYVVDASVWVSRFVPGDIHHETSRIWLAARVEQGDLTVMPALALAELAGAISRRTGQSSLATRAISLVLRLPNSRLVPIDAEIGEFAARLAADRRLRGADAVYVALASRLSLPLITWDLEQRERGRGIIMTQTPREALGQ